MKKRKFQRKDKKMVKKKRKKIKQKLSKAERTRRRKQALINFGLVKKRSSSKKRIKTKIKRLRGRKMAKRRKKKEAGFLSKAGALIGPIAYGMVREKISTTIANSAIGQKLPATGYTDEVSLLVLNELLRKFAKIGSMPVVGSMSRSLKAIELARIGQQLADDFLNKG